MDDPSGENSPQEAGMLTHQAAKRLANEYLQQSGAPFVATRATREANYGAWTVAYGAPDHPEEMLTGGGLLVTDQGEVYDVGATPGALTEPMTSLGRVPQRVSEFISRRPEQLTEAVGLPDSWREPLAAEFELDYWPKLLAFVAEERAAHDVFPPPSQTFAAFELTPFSDVRVVILGQDPYHRPGQAHGLSFSVPPGVRTPSSLINIHKQLAYDLEISPPDHGCLDGWARQGVLLLNTTLTVRQGMAHSHRRSDWKLFTDAVIRAISAKSEPVVFMLWGIPAKKKRTLVDTSRHHVVESSHPSGLSVYRGFNTSTPFSEANEFLDAAGRGTIDWSAFRPPS
jgi:uracil-DNA glycosylase